MASENFAASLSYVLKHEGGYTNDKEDPGGPTNYGITIADARMYWKKGATADDVRSMPLDVAKGIYKSKYWDRMDCDNLPSGVDYCVFDYGVNSGVGRAVPIYKKFEDNDPVDVINDICDERMAFLKQLKIWPTYGKGWTRRVAEVRKAAIEMTHTAPQPIPLPQPPTPPPRQLWQVILDLAPSFFRRK